MRTEELFIGAWVQYIGKPFRVLGIITDFFGNYRCKLSGDPVQWISVSNLQPLLLTEKLLKKNGFEKTKTDKFFGEWKFRPENYGRTIYITNINCINGGFDIGCYRNGQFIDHLHLQYVHELQLCLRLGETEKEIAI